MKCVPEKFWYRVSPSSDRTGVLIKKENLDIDIYMGRMPWEVAEIQEKPRKAKEHQTSPTIPRSYMRSLG